MSNIDGYLKNYMLYYADKLNLSIENLISKDQLASEQEAKDLLLFIDAMCNQSAIDMKEKINVLGVSANTYEAEKATMAIQDFIEDSGFDYLIDDDLEIE